MKLHLHSGPAPKLPVHRPANAALEVIGPAPREVWRALYGADPEALPSQSPEWLDCLCAWGYKDASRLYVFADAQQVLLPAVKRRGVPDALSAHASLPYAWSVGGVISRRPLEVEHLRAIFAELARTPFLTFKLLPNPLQGPLWEAARPERAEVIPRRAHVLDLEGGFAGVWAERFSKTVRTAVRKAEKSGVSVECDTTGRLAPIFNELLQRSVDRWAERQHEPRWLAHLRANKRDPLAKIQHVAARMGASYRIWVAWHGGEPVAASTVLVGKSIDGLVSVSDKALATPVAATTLIKKCIIEDACALGCRAYHLGESGASVGIAQFKESFGAKPYAYHEYRLERLPVGRIDLGLRSLVKHVIGFKD